MRPTNSIKAYTLLDIYEVIKKVSLAHASITHFDSGTELEFGNKKSYTYPMAYLEEVVNIISSDSGRSHTYDVALNILDIIDKDTTREERNRIQDGCYQTFLDILQYFRSVEFGQNRVLAFNVSVSPDFSNDFIMRVRGEFKLVVDTPFHAQNPGTDLKAVFPSLFPTE